MELRNNIQYIQNAHFVLLRYRLTFDFWDIADDFKDSPCCYRDGKPKGSNPILFCEIDSLEHLHAAPLPFPFPLSHLHACH
jgi:hypothetical protein